MLIKCDAKQLEWRVAVDLSNDSVGIAEICNKDDIHEKNRSFFQLPTRLIAKTFLFRLIFGGSEWAYANDPEFISVSDDPKFWRQVIDRTYQKYYGLAAFHEELIRTAMHTRTISIPSGREWRFEPYIDRWDRLKWPRTNILNYPVQGFAADLMSVIRVNVWERLPKTSNILMVNTIHDDIQFDVKTAKDVDTVAKIVYNVYSDLNDIVKSTYNYFLKVPFAVEIFFGDSLGDMEEYAN